MNYYGILTTCSQLKPSATFAEDLGLDSLDAVEVVMAVEEVCSNVILSSRVTLNVIFCASVGVLH